MKARVHIEKRFTSDNGKVFRIGNKMKCVAYDVAVEENCNYEGIILDIFDNYFVLEKCKINGKTVYGNVSIPYHGVEEDSCYFVHD